MGWKKDCMSCKGPGFAACHQKREKREEQIKWEIACITWMIKPSSSALECVWFLDVLLCWMHFFSFHQPALWHLLIGKLCWWQNNADLPTMTFVRLVTYSWRWSRCYEVGGKKKKMTLFLYVWVNSVACTVRARTPSSCIPQWSSISRESSLCICERNRTFGRDITF